MADAIWGGASVLEMWVTDQYYPVLCATDSTYNCAAEFIEKTGPTSGGAREWMRRLEEHTGSATGLTKVDNDASLTFFYILQVGVRRVQQLFRQTFADVDGNSKTLTGYALIGTMGINQPVNDFSNCTLEIKWQGAPEQDVIPPPTPEAVFRIYLLGATGQSSVQDNVLIGASNLAVGRSTSVQTDVSGGAFTPGEPEFMFDDATGTVSFDTGNPFNAPGEIIWVLYKT